MKSLTLSRTNLVNILANTVENWDLFEEYIDTMATRDLGEDISQHPLFFVEPPIHSRAMRLKLVDMAFQKFGTNSLYVHKGPILASLNPN